MRDYLRVVRHHQTTLDGERKTKQCPDDDFVASMEEIVRRDIFERFWAKN
jgi:hypothetical protein